MKIEIHKLVPEFADDFFDFFDNRAFTDNSPEGPCYCTRFQMTKEQEKKEFDQVEAYGGGSSGFMRVLRKIAEQQIESGALRGYLAFVDGISIGWCNTNDKANFPVESGNGARFYAPVEKREKVVACFEIAPEFRGKGVATALLQRVVDDAAVEGYMAVEGFPRKRGERYEWDFTGPIQLYEKIGFQKVTEQDRCIVMRKRLQ
ncbi:MAG: GNAT family N-acetyltransferase [Oscillospiraceae bacterium]|nr:GNAT family N-acetyltransferase [Oscillospiraceae bacterium]